MNVTPISFGKSVRIIGNKEQAYDIARLANEKKVSKAERNAQKEAQAIFDDIAIGDVQIATYTTPYNEEEVYLVSGIESQKLKRLEEQIATGIIQAGDSLGADSDKFKKSVNRQMSRHNQRVRDLVLNSATNYDISATYNKKNTAVKSVDRKYDSVYAVAGSIEQIEELRNIIAKTKGYANFSYATDLYKGNPTRGLCNQAVRDGKEVAFIVTGKENNRNLSFMQQGWTSIHSISRRLQRFMDLKNIPEQAKAIQEAMEYDIKKESK